MPTQYCLALLELNGIGFSVAECEAQKNVMQAKLSDLENKAYQLAGHSFSLTSPEDVAEVCVNLGKPDKTLFVDYVVSEMTIEFSGFSLLLNGYVV